MFPARAVAFSRRVLVLTARVFCPRRPPANVRRLGRDFATCLEGRDFRISNSLLVLSPLLALPLQFLTTQHNVAQITNNRATEGLRERTEHLDIFLLFHPSLNGVVFPLFC